MSVTETSRYEQQGVLRGVYRTVRRSFLLSLAAIGGVLTLLGGGVLQNTGFPVLGAIIGTVGVTWILTGIAGYGLYRVLERRY
jgi:hypothetical protein